MGAFWKKNEDGKSATSHKVKVAKATKGNVAAKKVKRDAKARKSQGLIVPKDKADLINKVLIAPMISEAVMRAQEEGKYTFKVNRLATKREIAKAVEGLYKVEVVKVNIVNYKKIVKFFRGKKGFTKSYKKAVVTLKKGEEIKLFS